MIRQNQSTPRGAISILLATALLSSCNVFGSGVPGRPANQPQVDAQVELVVGEDFLEGGQIDAATDEEREERRGALRAAGLAAAKEAARARGRFYIHEDDTPRSYVIVAKLVSASVHSETKTMTAEGQSGDVVTHSLESTVEVEFKVRQPDGSLRPISSSLGIGSVVIGGSATVNTDPDQAPTSISLGDKRFGASDLTTSIEQAISQAIATMVDEIDEAIPDNPSAASGSTPGSGS